MEKPISYKQRTNKTIRSANTYRNILRNKLIRTNFEQEKLVSTHHQNTENQFIELLTIYNAYYTTYDIVHVKIRYQMDNI